MAVGGTVGEVLDEAAELLMLGLDPLRFLNTTDDIERGMIVEIYNRALKVKEIHDTNLASRIAEEVVKRIAK